MHLKALCFMYIASITDDKKKQGVTLYIHKDLCLPVPYL